MYTYLSNNTPYATFTAPSLDPSAAWPPTCPPWSSFQWPAVPSSPAMGSDQVGWEKGSFYDTLW